MVAEEEARRPSQLEIAVARCGASVWAPLPPQIPTEGPTAQIEELEARKRKIGDDLAAGVLRVDAAQPEIDAIETRLRELRANEIKAKLKPADHRINTSAAQPFPPDPHPRARRQGQHAVPDRVPPPERRRSPVSVGGFGLRECNNFCPRWKHASATQSPPIHTTYSRIVISSQTSLHICHMMFTDATNRSAFFHLLGRPKEWTSLPQEHID